MPAVVDLIIVGLGAVGSAALYQAAKLKARVVGIDRFAPPHEYGSSHGDTRITREAIGEGREFVPLVLRSHEIWEELEDATARSLMTRNGGLVLASRDMPGQHHGSRSFVQDTIDAAREFRIAHEVLSASEIQHRYPQFRLRGDELAYFEPGAGFVRPEACIQAQIDLAREAGAKVAFNETVMRIGPSANGTIEVQTNQGSYSAGHLILTAGAWIPKLLSGQQQHLFRVHRQTMCWFALSGNRDPYLPENFPIFIWITGNRPQDMMYGFPAIDDAEAVKMATELYATTTDPDDVPREVEEAEVSRLYQEYIAPRFPDVSAECVRRETCLYTVTPDARFIVDTIPDIENTCFASACSGHGFKHSAALGEALARHALQQPALVDLSNFSLSRFERG